MRLTVIPILVSWYIHFVFIMTGCIVTSSISIQIVWMDRCIITLAYVCEIRYKAVCELYLMSSYIPLVPW